MGFGPIPPMWQQRWSKAGKEISAINFKEYGNLLLLAVMDKEEKQINYNPPGTYCLQSGDTMIFQAELEALRKFCNKNSL